MYHVVNFLLLIFIQSLYCYEIHYPRNFSLSGTALFSYVPILHQPPPQWHPVQATRSSAGFAFEQVSGNSYWTWCDPSDRLLIRMTKNGNGSQTNCHALFSEPVFAPDWTGCPFQPWGTCSELWQNTKNFPLTGLPGVACPSTENYTVTSRDGSHVSLNIHSDGKQRCGQWSEQVNLLLHHDAANSGLPLNYTRAEQVESAFHVCLPVTTAAKYSVVKFTAPDKGVWRSARDQACGSVPPVPSMQQIYSFNTHFSSENGSTGSNSLTLVSPATRQATVLWSSAGANGPGLLLDQVRFFDSTLSGAPLLAAGALGDEYRWLSFDQDTRTMRYGGAPWVNTSTSWWNHGRPPSLETGLYTMRIGPTSVLLVQCAVATGRGSLAVLNVTQIDTRGTGRASFLASVRTTSLVCGYSAHAYYSARQKSLFFVRNFQPAVDRVNMNNWSVSTFPIYSPILLSTGFTDSVFDPDSSTLYLTSGGCTLTGFNLNTGKPVVTVSLNQFNECPYMQCSFWNQAIQCQVPRLSQFLSYNTTTGATLKLLFKTPVVSAGYTSVGPRKPAQVNLYRHK